MSDSNTTLCRCSDCSPNCACGCRANAPTQPAAVQSQASACKCGDACRCNPCRCTNCKC